MASGASAEPPTDQIASLPARAALRFSGHWPTFDSVRMPSAFMFLFMISMILRRRWSASVAMFSTSGEPSGMSRQPSPSLSLYP